MSAWHTIETAPRDGTEIELRVRRKVFRARRDVVCWSSDLDLPGEDRPVFSWCATTDEHPSDWDEGVCWGVNGDGRQSARPKYWRPLANPTKDGEG